MCKTKASAASNTKACRHGPRSGRPNKPTEHRAFSSHATIEASMGCKHPLHTPLPPCLRKRISSAPQTCATFPVYVMFHPLFRLQTESLLAIIHGFQQHVHLAAQGSRQQQSEKSGGWRPGLRPVDGLRSRFPALLCFGAFVDLTA